MIVKNDEKNSEAANPKVIEGNCTPQDNETADSDLIRDTQSRDQSNQEALECNTFNSTPGNSEQIKLGKKQLFLKKQKRIISSVNGKNKKKGEGMSFLNRIELSMLNDVDNLIITEKNQFEEYNNLETNDNTTENDHGGYMKDVSNETAMKLPAISRFDHRIIRKTDSNTLSIPDYKMSHHQKMQVNNAAESVNELIVN